MYIPKNYSEFQSKFFEISEKHSDLGKACTKAGPLDKKTQSLVKLGIAVGSASMGGVKSSVRKALDLGIKPVEIYHGIVLNVISNGLPSTIAAIQWAESVIESQKNN